MAQDTGFWTWPVDVAATQSGARGLAMAALVFYVVGAALLLLQTVRALPPLVTDAGIAAIVLGLAASVFVIAKVLVTRSRLTYH